MGGGGGALAPGLAFACDLGGGGAGQERPGPSGLAAKTVVALAVWKSAPRTRLIPRSKTAASTVPTAKEPAM